MLTTAIVSKPTLSARAPEQYLVVQPDGKLLWTADPKIATPFPSMREAMRMAFRLPASDRAFGLPHHVELAVH